MYIAEEEPKREGEIVFEPIKGQQSRRGAIIERDQMKRFPLARKYYISSF